MGADFAQAASFYGLAGITVLTALLVVSVRNIFHAALFLVLSFTGVAGVYLTLNAAVLAAVQVLVYAGAIAILMLFAVFLTRNAMTQGNPPGRFQLSASLLSALVFVVLSYSLINGRWLAGPATPVGFTPDQFADALFNNYVFPFEIASVLLLVAMIGAIVLAKE